MSGEKSPKTSVEASMPSSVIELQSASLIASWWRIQPAPMRESDARASPYLLT
jgi:hypothetical protein